MKKIFLLLTTLAIFTACKSDDEIPDPGNYQTPLPEATQTGKGTFACYVDGNAYIAKANEITSYYQYTNGSHVFGVAGTKELKPLWNISVGSTADELVENAIYTLKKRENGNQWGGVYFVYNWDDSYEEYTDNITYKGEFTITKLDLEKQIISGTFWFDVKDPKTGETRKVRDGRFDVVANF